VGLVAAALACAIGAGVAYAYAPVGSDFRISTVGTDTDALRGGFAPSVAYNSTANEYLVTWEGDGLATDDESEIFGQRLSAAGAELGSDFRISSVGTDTDTDRNAFSPSVAYNSTANEYLVSWYGDGLATDNEFEIFGQRLSAAGAELGSDFRISTVGADPDTTRDGFDPSVAYNSAANQYLVSWQGDGLATDNESEIFGQRLSAAGAELGTDFRISSVGTDTDATRDGSSSSVAYSSTANQYLVSWQGDGLATDNEFEIFGQRLGAAGAELGTDFRISSVGTDTDATRDGFDPSVAYNSAANQYLVSWQGDGLATDNEFEIFGQRLGAAGAELGTDFRISAMGTDTDTAREAFDTSVAYSSSANEYLVAWDGDGLATDDEFEIFGQRLSAAGAELGSDLRISSVGTDTDAARAAVAPSVAYSSTANEYLVAWEGDGLATDDEDEIFGHRLAPAATPPTTGTPPPATPPAKKKCKKKKKGKKGAVAAKKCKKKKKQ
jgi:phosphotransferase system HPr-like phosphotransfer protein